MADGLVQFLHRKIPPTIEEREAEKLRKKASASGLVRATANFEAAPEDIVIQEDKKAKESRHDYFLRKFEYSKALDQVLKPYVMTKYPEYTFSVLRELKRRQGLQTAIAGRDEKTLLPLLQYLHKNVIDTRFSTFLIEVVDITVDLYAEIIGTNPKIDRVFVDIKKRVDREARTLRQMMMLKGSLDLVLGSRNVKKPSLTCEEKRLKEQLKDNDDTFLFKLLNQ